MFDVAQQKSPVDRILETVTRPNGLQIKKVTTPIGVVGVINSNQNGTNLQKDARTKKSLKQ